MGNFINSSPAVHFHNNNSVLFDGTNDHMTMAGLSNDISTTRGSVSFWVKLDSTSSNANWFKASVDSNNQLGMTYMNSTTVMRPTFKAGGTSETVDIAFNFEGNDTWYHVAMTWDTEAGEGETGEFKAYLNGAQSGSTQAIEGTWEGSIDTVMAGKNTLNNNNYAEGHMSQLTVWKTALTSAQMLQLYNGGTPGNPLMNSNVANLVGWYGFNEGTGTSVADLSGTGNTGTLVNGAAFNTDTP